MQERELRLSENLVVRVGLFAAASYAFYIGVVQWSTGADALHPGVVLLQLATYLVAFIMLFSGATGLGLRWTRHLILAVFVFAVLIQAYFRIDGQLLSYGTDSAAFTHYAAELFARGENPYGQDLSPSLDKFRMPPTLRTSTTDGGFEYRLPYPALSFLFYVPFILAGVGDVRIVLVIFHLLLAILLYVAAPRWLRPLVLIPFFISPDIIAYTLGTVTDLQWVFFVTAAAILWKHRNASALLFGIALSIKQHPWLLLPFLALRLLYETRGLSVSERLNVLARYFGIAEVVFLLINGPFMLTAPQAWVNAVLAPPFGPYAMDGEGLSTLGQVGLLYAPRLFYTLAALAVATALLIVYWLNLPRLTHALWLFPAFILWFPYRSLQSYFIYWIPPLMVALFASVRASTVRQVLDARSEEWRTRLSVGVMASAAVFILAGIGYYAAFGRPSLQVDVQRAVLDPDTSLVQQIEVHVTNLTDQAVRPVFWVKQTGHPRFTWEVRSGPALLAAGESGQFVIYSSFQDYRVSHGTVLSVGVNDARDSDAVGFSTARAVNLTTRASLLNPDLYYWTKDKAGNEHPYGWGFYQLGASDTRRARISSAAFGEKQCTALSVMQTAQTDPPTWLGAYLDQWIEFPADRLLVPVYATFDYAGGDRPETVLGVEIRDKDHQLWYIFADEPERFWTAYKNNSVAYHLLPAPRGQWSDQVIDVAADYAALGWSLPTPQAVLQNGQTVVQPMVNMRLFVGTRSALSGSLTGCFGPIIQHLPE